MRRPMTESRLANLGGRAIARGFEGFQARFAAITDRARSRFEHRDWRGHQRDSRERLEVYTDTVDRVEEDIHGLLEDRVDDKLIWTAIKAVYSGLIADRDDWELAETFFNSVTRRIFTTVGVDPRVEFVASDFAKPPTRSPTRVYQLYDRAESTPALIESILTDFRFRALYEDIRRDARLASAEADRHLRSLEAEQAFERAEVLRAVFFRGKGAYIVGRLWSGARSIPLVLALRHRESGVFVDAVLLDEDDVSILFSFTRSYFHVAVDRPYDLVEFLAALLPRKRKAELYTSIGYHKHGKTELYRDLLDHLADGHDRFQRARGAQGLVMSVFTMPGFEVVFKVLRDVFGAPKTVTPQAVREKYRLVFRHDRAGRLIDAQEFEHLEFAREHFDPTLLEELAEECGRTVEVRDDTVVIRHAYVERRVAPLDLFMREVPESAAAAIADYGQAIKDLAASNIFPGDMLLKNFGVTRHGRVVFYDYDELTELLDCEFRRLPEATHPQDEMAAEAWFGVGEHDIFPEEFRAFLGLPAELREKFEQLHHELFEAEYWQGVQERLRSGEIIEIFPYGRSHRLAGA